MFPTATFFIRFRAKHLDVTKDGESLVKMLLSDSLVLELMMVDTLVRLSRDIEFGFKCLAPNWKVFGLSPLLYIVFLIITLLFNFKGIGTQGGKGL